MGLIHRQPTRIGSLTAALASIAASLTLLWGADAAAASSSANYSSSKSNTAGISYRSEVDLQSNVLGTALRASSGATWTEVEDESTKQKCHSAGAAEGEVKTASITFKLGWINKANDEVGLEEKRSIKSGGNRRTRHILAAFTCGAETVEIRGGVIGRLTPINTKITPAGFLTDDVALAEGKQAITHFEGGPTVRREIQINGGGFHEAPTDQPGRIAPLEGTIEVKAVGNKLPTFKQKPIEPKSKK